MANTTWTTSAKFGNALVFNGSSSFVTITDSGSLHLTTGMTLEAWVNPSAVSSAWRDVIYKGNDITTLEGTSDNSSRPAGGGTWGSGYADLRHCSVDGEHVDVLGLDLRRGELAAIREWHAGVEPGPDGEHCKTPPIRYRLAGTASSGSTSRE